MSVEFRIRYTLLQKFLPTDMIFFVQFIVSTVKVGKCFAELMDLLKSNRITYLSFGQYLY